MVLDVSVSDSYGNSDYDELEATLRLSASLVRELVVGRRVPDPRKNYNRKFSEIVAVFNSLTSTGASAKAANNACANCGTRHADEVCTSDGNAPVAEGIRIVSALKSLFRRRRLCVDFATK